MVVHKLIEGKILCERVPDFCSSEEDWKKVTCKFCLKKQEEAKKYIRNCSRKLNK